MFKGSSKLGAALQTCLSLKGFFFRIPLIPAGAFPWQAFECLTNNYIIVKYVYLIYINVIKIDFKAKYICNEILFWLKETNHDFNKMNFQALDGFRGGTPFALEQRD